jgi:hypothetical protein
VWEEEEVWGEVEEEMEEAEEVRGAVRLGRADREGRWEVYIFNDKNQQMKFLSNTYKPRDNCLHKLHKFFKPTFKNYHKKKYTLLSKIAAEINKVDNNP